MRILGADSFIGKTTSINAIPVSVLKQYDLCIVKIPNGNVDYIPAVYFLEYMTNDGNTENIPYIITPIDNLDGGDDGGRWKLKNIFVKSIHAGSLTTNSILSEVPGVPITIGDTFTVSPSGVVVDGQVVIHSDVTKPPLIVNSQVMVDNLNAEFIGGERFSSFVRNYDFNTSIPNGVREFNVYFSHNVVSPPNYTVLLDICNTTDPNPSIYGHIITRKEQNYFTVRFSGIIDSDNYTLHYFIIGEVLSPFEPPPVPEVVGGIIWNNISVDTFALRGNGYFVDTTLGQVVLTLPINPSFGDRIDIIDYVGDFATHNCIVARNGQKIMGLAENFVCDIDRLSMVMIYSGLTFGWRIIDYTD
jgi:hypothetical protein